MIHLVIPKNHEGHCGAGQWKDLQGIRQILSQLGAAWGEFAFTGGNTAELIAAIGDAADVVIWYYSFWPEALAQLKAGCPRARIVLRTVNAEALQHWTRAEKNWRRLRGLPRDTYGFVRLLWRDGRCARAADVLAGISPWDDARYWRRLTRRDKTRSVPYLCPWPALLPAVVPRPWAEREDVMACLAGARDAIGQDHVERFLALARRPEFSKWRFVLSAGLMDASRDRASDRVERIGRLDEPWSLLCRVKAVALLSPLGSGYKTTATDARMAGCHVMIHSKQYDRLTAADRQAAHAVDSACTTSWAAIADRVARPPDGTPKESWACALQATRDAWREVCAP